MPVKQEDKTKIIKWDGQKCPTAKSLRQLRMELEDENIEYAIEVFYAALKENIYHDYCGPEKIEVRGDIIDVWAYHTGGWSGNEDIIDILEKSSYFKWLLKRYDAGGHYYFKICQQAKV